MADVIVSPGNSLKVDYIVENFGDDPDTQDVELVRTDTGTVVDSVTGIQLDTGNIDTGELIWSSGSTPEGDYTFELNTADDTELIDVLLISLPTAGTQMYISGNGSSSIHKYTLSTPFDISTATLDNSVDVSISGSFVSSVIWDNRGQKVYVVAYNPGVLEQYSTSTPFSISGLTSDGQFDLSPNNTQPVSMIWNSDGSSAYIVDYDGAEINQYSASTAFDYSTATFIQSLDVSTNTTNPYGIAWDKDGTRLYLGALNTGVVQYNLTAAFDISTATYTQTLDTTAQDDTPSDIDWNVDGTKLFIAEFTSSSVHSYNLSTAFDISTASFNQSFDVSSEETSARGFTFTGGTHYNTYK